MKFWSEFDKYNGTDLNAFSKLFVENLLNESFKRRSLDNISAVFIGFEKLL